MSFANSGADERYFEIEALKEEVRQNHLKINKLTGMMEKVCSLIESERLGWLIVAQPDIVTWWEEQKRQNVHKVAQDLAKRIENLPHDKLVKIQKLLEE